MQPTVTLIKDNEWRSSHRPDEDACFGSLATDRGHLPLEAMDIRAQITGLAYQLKLRQTFVNNLAAPLEASYIFPLPPRAAVTDFRLRVANREVVGEIQERGAARRTYDQAIASGHRAAIAEEERSGVFTMRVGNLMAGDRAIVELTITGPVELEDGCATFRFPLVVAPRYIPGVPLDGASVGDGDAADTDAVPDASRISPPVLLPGYPNPVRLSMAVELDPAGLSLSNLRCALHAEVVETRGNAFSIAIRPGERLNRDFVLRYDIAAETLTTCLYAAPDAGGEGGTFCLTAVPPRGATAAAKPRDVVFVLDRSGSMGGWKMIAARRAVARMIDSLGGSDRFSVLAFDNRIDTCPALGDDLTVATDRNRYRAVEFLAGLEARGGTEMLAPLVRGASLLGSGYRDRERVLVLVTDGQVGNEDQILRQLAPTLGARMFTVGIDRAVNEGFLRRLAAIGAGSCSIVESEDRLDEAMDVLHRRIGEPIITELAIRGDGFEIDADSVTPRRLPDLFASSPAIIWGRYRGAVKGSVVLSGVNTAGDLYKRELTPTQRHSDAAASIWARGRLRQLEDDYVIGSGDKGKLADAILRISLAHKVLCRFSAFVAVDRAAVVNPGGHNVAVTQPVEMPEGWSGGGASDAKPDSSRGRAEMRMQAAAPMDSFAEEVADFEAGAVSLEAPSAPMGAPAGYGGFPMQPAKSEVGQSRAGKGRGLASPPPPSRAMPSPAPRKKAKVKKPALLRRIAEMLPSRDERVGADAPIRDAEVRALLARLESILERHQSRIWLDGAMRLARLLIELAELLADLRSLGNASAAVAAVTEARRQLESDGGDPDMLLRQLIDSIKSGAPPQPANVERADEPFWR